MLTREAAVLPHSQVAILNEGRLPSPLSLQWNVKWHHLFFHLSWHLDGRKMTIWGRLPALHLLHGPSKDDVTNTDAIMSYYRALSFLGVRGGVSPLPDQAICLRYVAGLPCAGDDMYPWALIWHKVRDMAKIHKQTWESPKSPGLLWSRSTKGNLGRQKYPANKKSNLEFYQT